MTTPTEAQDSVDALTASNSPVISKSTLGATLTVIVASITTIYALLAPIDSPTFTGTPLAPTAAQDTNTPQIATTAFVIGQASGTTPLMDSVATIGSSLRYARGDHIHPTDTSRAPTAFTQSGTGAVTTTVDAKLKRLVKNVADFGADVTGATDSAGAVNACLTSLSPEGGICQLADTDKIKITSTNINIPKNGTLSCSATAPGLAANSDYDFGTRGGIRLSSARIIVNGGSLENCMIYRDGMTFPTADSSAFAGIATQCIYDNANFRNLLIIGFDRAITCNGYQRIKIHSVNIDALNPVQVCNSADSSDINDVHAWPFATIASYSASPSDAKLRRVGIGFEICGQNDDANIDSVLAYGYDTNFKFSQTGYIHVGRIWSDYPGLSVTTSRGIWLTSPSTISIDQIFTSNTVQPIYIDGTGAVTIDSAFVQGFQTTTGTQTAAPNCVVVAAGAVNFKFLQVNGCSTWTAILASTSASLTILSGKATGLQTGASAPYIANVLNGTTENLRVLNFITDQATGTPLIGANPLLLPEIPSAAALLLRPNSDEFRVTGVTAITSISGGYGKREIELQFAGIVTVTHGVSLLLAGAANFNTTAGSRVRFRYDPLQNGGAGGWIELWRRIV